MQNINREKEYKWVLVNEGKIKIKGVKKRMSLREEKKKLQKGEILNNKILNLKFENEEFMIGFLIWEIKPFKLLMKTYPEKERLKLRGISNKKLQKYKNRDNKSLGGYYCIEESKNFEEFEKKLKFLLNYNQYIEIEFIRLYNHKFDGIKEAYELIEKGKKKKKIIENIENRRINEKENIIFLIYYFYFDLLQKHIIFENFLKR